MTQTNNGQVPADFEVEIEDGPRRYLPTYLTPRDHRRAKAALADVLEGRSTYDMLDDDEDRVPFTIWCLRSRTDPGFSWDDALDTPYLAEWKEGPPGPPPTGAPPAGGAKTDAPGSLRKPNGRGTAPSSASTTASQATSTTT